jgi:hypothetical protein
MLLAEDEGEFSMRGEGVLDVFMCVILALVVLAFLLVRRRNWRSDTQRTSSPPPRVSNAAPSTVIAGLRQNLRLKVSYDEEKIDRLIEHERQRLPKASLQVLMESAIERWERDNR